MSGKVIGHSGEATVVLLSWTSCVCIIAFQIFIKPNIKETSFLVGSSYCRDSRLVKVWISSYSVLNGLPRPLQGSENHREKELERKSGGRDGLLQTPVFWHETSPALFNSNYLDKMYKIRFINIVTWHEGAH